MVSYKRKIGAYVFCQNNIISLSSIAVIGWFSLKQDATWLLLLFDLEGGAGGRLKHLADTLLALGRAFQICKGVYLFGHSAALLWLYLKQNIIL